MPRYCKIVVVCLIALVLIMSPLSGFSAEVDEGQQDRLAGPTPDPGLIVVDLVAVRPLGVVATLAGSVVFIVAVPFAALGGNTDEVWESLVVDPAEFTFKRPLGRFED
ncbi:MAG TPA: hypothetical protein ENN06_06315 [Desulfobacteraceae bacterium]|nr:hypothetical protein [Desulfobacteraceae bacterium]